MLFSAKEIEEKNQKILRKPKTSAENDFPYKKRIGKNKSKIKTAYFLSCFKDSFVLDESSPRILIKVPNWAKNKPIEYVLEADIIRVATVS